MLWIDSSVLSIKNVKNELGKDGGAPAGDDIYVYRFDISEM